MRRRSGLAGLLCSGLLVAALGAPAGARVVGEAGLGCSWPLTLRNINFAYPDTSADYWMTHFGAVPGSSLKITGEFPNSRYFSFHAYDEAQKPVASISDHEIIPDEGMNPFDKSIPGRGPQSGTYTVRVVFEPEPEKPEPNTVYAGTMDNGAPNPAGFVIYRIYIPDDPESKTASVPLPDVTLETPGGEVQLGQCEALPPPTGEQVDETIRNESYPETGRQTQVPGVENPPLWKRFYGTDREFRDWCPNGPCEGGPKMESGFLANQQIAYLYARTSREFGEVVVVRLKTPSFPDTRAGDEPTDNTDVRYWSICQNNALSQRVVDCSADYQTIVDADGFATFVISDPADRPKTATRENGINWLPWGGAYYEGIIIYRHMLPAKSFKEAIQNIPEGTPPAKVMKDYMPVSAYCTPEEFDRSGAQGCLSAGLEE